jgi:putative membrane-bound dehydrogenase-like protein
MSRATFCRAVKYDKSTVFAENLNFPNGILPWRKGVIVTCAPDVIYLEDTTGNGKADKKEVLYTGFTQGNPQLRINTPTYGLDNWVYLANGLSSRDIARSTKTGATIETSGRDVRIRPDEGAIEPETGVSQYGRKMDDWGNWFGVHNSFPVRSFIIPDRYANRNKIVQLPRGYDDAGLPANPKVYAISKGQKRYGYAFFEQSGHFTSACQLTPYRDNLLFPMNPASGADHVFVCEPAHNLVQHLVLKPSASAFLATRAVGEEFNEFLASEDDWCRPCFLSTGPDGALWMVDIYRFFIDHPDFLPPEGKQDMRPFYRLGDEMGRIYRIYPKGSQPRPIPRLDKLDTPHLVAALDSPSGWQRDMVQMMLVWQKDAAAVAPLEEFAEKNANPLARMHAICTLDGLGQLKSAVIERALRDANPAVRRQAVRLTERYAKASPQLITAAVQLADDPEPMVRLQLAFTLGEWDTPAAGSALAKIALGAGDDIYLSAAITSSATNHYSAIADALIAANKASPLTPDLLAMALAENNRDLAARLLSPVFTLRGGKFQTAQLEAFAQFLDALELRHTTPAKVASAKADLLAGRLERAASLFAAARAIAPKSDQPVEHRVAATALLGRDQSHVDEDLKLLAALLAPDSPPAVQSAAVRSLTRINREEVPAILLRGWKDDRPQIRNAILDAMLARESWALELLKRIEAHDLSAGDFDPSRRQRLIHHASPRVSALADKWVGESSASSRNKVLDNYRSVHDLAGDAARGEKVFAANCVTCHHLGNMGNEIGPNLQSVAAWPTDALMVAILDPSRSAEPRYLSYNCALETGETVYGLMVRESAAGVVIKGIDAVERVIPRRQIKSLECTNRSLMPDGLEAAIDKQGMADLIKFLQTQGRREND